MIKFCIFITGDVFDSLVFKDEIPITDMPSVQHGLLFREIYETIVQYRRLFCSRVISVDFLELRDGNIKICNISPVESLM